MVAVATDPVDSRSRQRHEFLAQAGYRDPDPSNQSLTMLLPASGRRTQEVLLPSRDYALLTWRDEYLDDWLRVRNTIFEGEMTAEAFRTQYGPHNFDPRGWHFIIYRRDVVGIAGVVLTRAPDAETRGGHFVGVGVLPEHRGRGLGRALMAAGTNYCVERGLSPVTLNTEPFRKAALSLYHEFGFEIVARGYRYRKDLTAQNRRNW
jgi:ribosomal protein S18 acetylase RimI-like enzyme